MEHLFMEWSSCSTWLALASKVDETMGQIDFFMNNGQKASITPIARNFKPTCFSWNPIEPYLIIGWQDGCVNLTNAQEEFEHTVENESSSSIFHVDWSYNGKSFVTVREDGIVSLYSFLPRKDTNGVVKLGEYSIEETPIACCKKLFYEVTNEPKKDVGFAIEDDKKGQGVDEKEKPKKSVVMKRKVHGTNFLIVGDNHNLHSIHETGEIKIVHTFDTTVHFLGFYEEKRLLIALSQDVMLHHITCENEKFQEKFKVKLSGKFDNYRLLLNENILLISYYEKDIRVWDLESEEHGTIALQTTKGFSSSDVCICLGFCSKKGVISAGTLEGKVANWRKRPHEKSIENTWKLQNSHEMSSQIKSLRWSPLNGSLAVNTGANITILNDEQHIISFHNKVAAIQSSASTFILLNVVTSVTQELKVPFTPIGVHVSEKQMVVWNKETIMAFDVQTSLATLQSASFACASSGVIVYQHTLYCIEGDKINARTIQGTVKQILSLPEMEGDPAMMNLNRNCLTIGTTNGFIRICSLTKKEARQEYHSKYVIESLPNFHKFATIKINNLGNRVAFTYYETHSKLSNQVVIWDAESDHVMYFSFDKGMTDQQEYEAEAEMANTSSVRPVTAAARKMEKEKTRFRMMHHHPGALQWDENDSRYLVVEAIPSTYEIEDSYILSMFITAEHGLQLHDLQKKSQICDKLIGISVPYLYFLKKTEFDDEDQRGEKTVARVVVAKTLREFIGIEDCDEDTRKGMLDFSLFLTLGHMDEAFKAIKFIKSDSVWEQMASMSVKTRRLDVAAVCLGHMKNVRGARALREAQRKGESEDMQCAAIAIELGMLDEAEALYATNDRFDMVNKIDQAQNSWNHAFSIAEKKDRIHLRNTHYSYAKYLESMGAHDGAIDNYEQSETHQFEVTRMLQDNPKALETYIRKKRDPELYKWWARYLESIGEMEGAINFYTIAQDSYNVVRIMANMGKTQEASTQALQTSNKSACYHMAKTYESAENFEDAVNFYTKAHAFSSAIRLAKAHGMKDKLANLCLMAGGSELVEAAKYYEDLPGYAHKAVMLYHKAGMIGRALDLAFRTEQFSALDLVAKDLDSTTDSSTLKRAAEFFESNQNYEKAVELLCLAKEFKSALQLCRRKNVSVTEKIGELMTPTKETTPNVNERKDILMEIGDVCLQQALYTIAAKKYTQAGDKTKAMKALLKTGDVQKIRFFANTARSKEIYILAANFLQSVDWQGNAELMKDIETFYTKSQSPEHLANFYVSCAHMEIENWSQFDQAEGALMQAAQVLEKAEKSGKTSNSMNSLQQRVRRHLDQILKFKQIKGVYTNDQTEGVRLLTTLAEEATIDDIIRPNNIFTLLIDHHIKQQSWSAAYRCVTQLLKQQPNYDIISYIGEDTMNKICDEMGVARLTSKGIEEDDSDHDDEVDFSHAMKRQQRVDVNDFF
ncbi:unnamed protein product [Auanema sp. JU1783]|nr:unnamed protein product [Auanema sp. JU1783]